AEIDASTPVQSGHDPASGATVCSSSPTITFSTDENARCRWSLSDQAYGSMSSGNTCDSSYTTSHSCGTSGLSGAPETVYIACTDDTDVSANADTVSSNTHLIYTIDTSAPVVTITGIGGDTSSPYSTSDTTPIVTATTDETADCRASLYDETYSAMSNDIDCSGDGTSSHSCQFGTISEQSAEYFYVSCQDTCGNQNSAANNEQAAAEIDASTPVQSSHNPASGSTIKTTSQTITFSTDENARCRWSLSDQAYGSMSSGNTCDAGFLTSHSCSTSGLSQGSEIVYIACTDDTDVSANADTIASNTHISYTVDTTNPSTSITSPSAGSWQRNDFQVTYSDSDSESGLDTCYYRILDSGTPT
ncbi:MAG: hypothetical protein JW779_11315, partial [Candidatus Thorarchaeota archaeon]|nr:hypothetical protein [Candidatus Thorarchaeota archaeon]